MMERLTLWRKHRFFTVVVAAFAILIENLMWGMVLPMLPVIKAEFDVDDNAIGGLVAAYAAIQIAVCPIAALLVDRFGGRKILFVGLSSMFCSTLLFATANSFWLLVVARLFQGGSAGVSWTAALSLLPVALPASEQGRATSMVTAVGGIGSVSGPTIGGALYAVNDSRRTPFYFMLFMIAIDLALRSLLIDTVRPELVAESKAPKPPLWTSVKELFRDPAVALLMWATAVGGMMLSAIMPILPQLIVDRFQFSPWQTGLVMSARAATYLLGSILVGWLADKFKIGRHLISAGFVALPLLNVGLAYADSVWLFCVLLALVGFFLTCTTTTSMSELAVQIDKNHHSRVYPVSSAAQNVIWSAATFVSPLVSSAIAESSGPALSLCAVAGISAPLGLVFVFFSTVPPWSTRWFLCESRNAAAAAAAATESLLDDTDDRASEPLPATLERSNSSMSNWKELAAKLDQTDEQE